MALKNQKFIIGGAGELLIHDNIYYSPQRYFPSEKLAKSARNYEQLLKVMWVYNGGEFTKKATWGIYEASENWRKFKVLQHCNSQIQFLTEELAELALKNFPQLFKDFYMIDWNANP